MQGVSYAFRTDTRVTERNKRLLTNRERRQLSRSRPARPKDWLSLVSCELDLLELAVENPAALEQRLGALIVPGWEDFHGAMKVSRDRLQTNPELSGWWTHLVLADSPPKVVGVCGYTGPPTAEGVVEIA